MNSLNQESGEFQVPEGLIASEVLKNQARVESERAEAVPQEKSVYQQQLEQKLGINDLGFEPLQLGKETADGAKLEPLKDISGKPIHKKRLYVAGEDYGELILAIDENYLGGEKDVIPPGMSVEEFRARKEQERELIDDVTFRSAYKTDKVQLVNGGEIYLFSDAEGAVKYRDFNFDPVRESKGKAFGNLSFVYDRSDYSSPRMAIINITGEAQPRVFRAKEGEVLTTEIIMEKLLNIPKREFDEKRKQDDEARLASLRQGSALKPGAKAASSGGPPEAFPEDNEDQQPKRRGLLSRFFK